MTIWDKRIVSLEKENRRLKRENLQLKKEKETLRRRGKSFERDLIRLSKMLQPKSVISKTLNETVYK